MLRVPVRRHPGGVRPPRRLATVDVVLTLHHDITDATAAVAVLRLQALADAGVPVRFSPFDVLGLEISIPPTLDLLAGLERERARAAALGLALRPPSRQPPTLRAHVVGGVAEAAGMGAAWRLACLRAYWTEDQDLTDATVLVGLAASVGLDGEVVAGRLADTGAVQELREAMLAQRRRGIGGVPVLELDGTFVTAEVSDDDLRHLAGL